MELLEKLEKMEEEEERLERMQPQIEARRASALTVAAVFALIFAAGLFYVVRSNTIYFWDDSTYWDMSRSVAEGDLNGRFWSSVFESVATSDYNYIAALPSALWALIFGMSREAYVAGLMVMYVLPSFILLYRIAKKVSKAPKFAFSASVLMFPALMFLAASGFADVGGLLIALACYDLYYTKDGTSDKWYSYAAIGVLLTLIMVFRRYFAFFSVSFITAMAVDCIVFGRRWRYLFITGGTAALILCTVLFPFLTGILLKDYGTLYAGYKYSVGTDLKLITRYFGLIPILAMLAAAAVSAVKRNEMRPVFLWLQMLICAAMFMATQTHGQQHLLLYIPALSVMAVFAVNCINRQWILPVFCLMIAAGIVNVYIPREQPQNIREIDHIALLPDFSMQPKHRGDTEAILTLKRDMDAAVADGSRCGVMISSFRLNASILRNVEQSLNAGITRDPDYIFALPEVDSRDADRLGEIYDSEYVLISVPSETHLAQGEQTIVDETVSSFANGTDIAEAFEEVEGFARTIDGFEVRLYRRTEDVGLYMRSLFESRLFY